MMHSTRSDDGKRTLCGRPAVYDRDVAYEIAAGHVECRSCRRVLDAHRETARVEHHRGNGPLGAQIEGLEALPGAARSSLARAAIRIAR